MSPEELFEQNEKLVFHAIRKLRANYSKNKMQLEPEDMIQVGYIGLWKAANGFNPDLGIKFSSYAIPTIIGEIGRELRDKAGSIKIPRQCKLIWKKIVKTLDARGGIPSKEAIQEEFQCSKDDARIISDMFHLSVTSDAYPIGNDGMRELYLSDVIADVNIDFENDLIRTEMMEEIFSLLTDREKFVVGKLLEEYTQAQIGRMLGISQVQISRIYRKAISKIKTYYEVEKHENEPQFT